MFGTVCNKHYLGSWLQGTRGLTLSGVVIFFSFSLLLLGWMGIEERVRMLNRKKCTTSRKGGQSTRIFTTK